MKLLCYFFRDEVICSIEVSKTTDEAIGDLVNVRLLQPQYAKLMTWQNLYLQSNYFAFVPLLLGLGTACQIPNSMRGHLNLVDEQHVYQNYRTLFSKRP